MFEKQFEKLGLTEKDSFVRLVNQLLGHTFLLVDEYDFEEGVTRVNKDYLFVERNLELFQEYFYYAGFRLERDRNYGVIYLTSSYEGSRARFDKLTTLIVYTLRLIYDEEREKLTLSQDVFCTVGDLVHKMISLGAVTKKPANVSLNDALRTLSRFRVILKTEGAFDQPQTRFLILPISCLDVIMMCTFGLRELSIPSSLLSGILAISSINRYSVPSKLCNSPITAL